MLPYQRILVATDFSENGAQAVKRAYLTAQASTHCKLSIVHVMELSPVAYGGEFSIPINANLEQQLEAKAREEISRIGDQYGIAPDSQFVLTGSVKIAVVELAEKLNADLIIVGTHGHTALGVLLGSRANAILHYAKCDVLVVK